MKFLKSFLKYEGGATMIEYGLVAALLSVAGIFGMAILDNFVCEYLQLLCSSQ